MFLLDINVVSELRRATFAKADPGVTAWAAALVHGMMVVTRNTADFAPTGCGCSTRGR